MQALLKRRLASAVLLACVCAAASADNGVAEAANGAPVGPLLQAPHGEELYALLQLGSEPALPYDDRVFANRYEPAASTTQGYVEVVLSSEGISHPYAPYVLFDAPACEGQAYLSTAAAQPARSLRAAIVGAEGRLYLASADEARLVPIASRLAASGCRPFSYAIRAYPMHAAGNLLQRLPPPYRIQAGR